MSPTNEQSEFDLPARKTASPKSDKKVVAPKPTEPRRELRIVAHPKRILSKVQQKFNRLVQTIERLREERVATARRLDVAVAEYVKRVHPEEKARLGHRREFVRVLGAAWRDKKALKKERRLALNYFLANQFSRLREETSGEMDADLLALETELKREAMEDVRAQFQDPAAQRELLAAGIDLSDVWDDGDPAEVMKKFFRKMKKDDGATNDENDSFFEGPRAGGDDAEKASRKQSAGELKRAKRQAELEEARKRSVASIYKQLAKLLHPDLERDPARRCEKESLMQELTAAYRVGDLHTLLRLELEFIHKEQGDLERLGEEKLKIYCELLTEQIGELEQEVYALHEEPRYGVLRPYFQSFTGKLPSWNSVVGQVRAEASALKETVKSLQGPERRKHLRELINSLEDDAGMGGPFGGGEDFF